MNLVWDQFFVPTSPVLVVIGVACLLVFLECFPKLALKDGKFILAVGGCVGALLLSACLGQQLLDGPGVDPAPVAPWLIHFGRAYKLDLVSTSLFSGISLFTVIGLVMMRPQFKESTFYGETLILTLFISAGMMLLISANSLLMVFLALETLSLPTYVLVGIQRKSRASTEAALKYFLFGSLASVFLVFGIALVYAQTASLFMPEIANALASSPLQNNLLALAGLCLITVAAAFKVGAVPFHMWVPDVYQGAPASVTAFMGSAIKLAGFGLAIRLFWGMFLPLASQWGPILDVLAVTTMFVGNLAALTQDNLKRMLAYSSVAHAGYLLLGVASVATDSLPFGPIYYYLVTYGLMFLGAFGVLALLEKAKGSTEIGEIAGLGATHPILAACLAVFALSAAGIPPTAGFFAKYFLFVEAVRVGKTTLVIAAVVSSVIGAYYYLRVLSFLYMKEPREKWALPKGERLAFSCIIACALSLFALAFRPF